METYDTKTEESETPLYNMTLELANINLYEMSEGIRRLGGKVLGMNTDSAACAFSGQQAPRGGHKGTRHQGVLLRR